MIFHILRLLAENLALFSSDWAARGAIELYGADKNKVKVVPFGANIQTFPAFDDVNSNEPFGFNAELAVAESSDLA